MIEVKGNKINGMLVHSFSKMEFEEMLFNHFVFGIVNSFKDSIIIY